MNKILQKTKSQNLSDDELVLISGGADKKGLSDLQVTLVEVQIMLFAGSWNTLSGKPRG
jgi:hypothetical protein